MEKYNKKPVQKNRAVVEYLEAGEMYAKALQLSIEVPTPENIQKVLETGRTVMLKAAGLISQETMEKLGNIQRERMMKDG